MNWKLFGFTIFTWILTVPFCAVLSGVLYGIIAYSPQASCDPIRVRAFSDATMRLFVTGGGQSGSTGAFANGVNTTVANGATFLLYPTNC